MNTERELLDSADRRWQGNGSIMPDQLESEEKSTFTVNPLSFTVLTREN